MKMFKFVGLGLFITLVALIIYFLFGRKPPAILPAPSSSSSSTPPASASSIPILVYHHIRINTDPSNKIEVGLDVPLVNFTEQMVYLSDRGAKTSFLDELFIESSEKRFIITFDDGYKDVIENAYPVLNKYGFKATVFIITSFVGKDGYLTWDDIKFLQKEGWAVGSHTISHPDLVAISKERAEKEIAQSKKILEDELKIPIDYFCYPAGKFNQDIVDIVKKAGYKGATTTIYGKENKIEETYQLKRVRINGPDNLTSFKDKVKF